MCRFVLNHELVQENLKGVPPHFDRRLPPVPLLLSHYLLQDLLKQCMKVFVADTLAIIHLGRSHRKSAVFIFLVWEHVTFQFEWLYSNIKSLQRTYCECCGVGVEDIKTKFLQSLFKHDVHQGVLFTVLCIQVVDLKHDTNIA